MAGFRVGADDSATDPVAARATVYNQFPGGPPAFREATRDVALARLFDAAVKHAEDRIDWYARKAAERAKVAKRIRRLALLLFAAGTLAPVLLTLVIKLSQAFEPKKADTAQTQASAQDTANWFNPMMATMAQVPWAEAGYLLLALAGAIVIFDQFFDASGSWIRYRQAEARLQVLLADFRFRWVECMAAAGGVIAGREQAARLVALLREFVTRVEILAEEETREWARRFSERIDAFDRNPSLKVRLDAAARNSRLDPEEMAPVASTEGSASVASRSAQTGPVSLDTAGSPLGASAEMATAYASSLAATPVDVRLAISDAEKLDADSLSLTVDEMPVDIGADGLVELSLTADAPHRIAASGRLQGRVVQGELRLTPSVNDQDRGFCLTLV